MSDPWLILETSGRIARVGLARAGSVVRAVSLDDTRRHARDLAATVGQLLNAESLNPSELSGVMVSRGPGSYTGLRVGLMSAKALAYATGCKLIAVDTFAAIAAQAPVESDRQWVIADALQNHIYVQKFLRSSGGEWLPEVELQIVRVEDSLRQAVAGTWMSGPGVKVYADRIPNDSRCVPEADREPRVESVFKVGQHLTHLTREQQFTLEPLYLRGSSAEEKAKAEGK
ncbi:MAG TPA: tRNA (adenosine(37)-N6)-threonylcarbamoyltransferase complex dimerization subunit type 1 TsaB [Gemmata sp.]|jgi:tRNA threonylcarbamoyladenosine biosynthesis protein TsaB|nr:tRNA (adenosine(37)-N6)-threonylcarbamoyltransferase complex dimerization subunit type 1 TsaB [Gemmata sp.]